MLVCFPSLSALVAVVWLTVAGFGSFENRVFGIHHSLTWHAYMAFGDSFYLGQRTFSSVLFSSSFSSSL